MWAPRFGCAAAMSLSENAYSSSADAGAPAAGSESSITDASSSVLRVSPIPKKKPDLSATEVGDSTAEDSKSPSFVSRLDAFVETETRSRIKTDY